MATDPKRQANALKRKPYLRKLQISDRHLKVVNEYFSNGFHQGNALRACGYAENTAKKDQYVVFQHPAVLAEIEARRDKLMKKHDVDADWVIQRLARIANADIGMIFHKLRTNKWDVSVLTPEESYVVNELSEEVELKSDGHDADGVEQFRPVRKGKLKGLDKLGALNALGRHLKLFTDKIEVSDSEDMVKRLQAGRARVAKGE